MLRPLLTAWFPVMLRPLLMAAIFLCAALVACSSAGVPEVPAGPDGKPDPVLVAGRQVYVERCANCHGDDGGGGRGSRLSDGVTLARYPGIAEQIGVVADGVRAMPAFADVLTPEQIEAVTRFTREVL